MRRTISQLSISEFLSDNMNSLAEGGVNTLYFEMVRSEHQEVIDQYYQDGDKKKLTQYFIDNGWDKIYSSPGLAAETYAGIIEAARDNGIRVVGIDIPNTGNNRLETSNPAWERTIENDLASNGLGADQRFIIFGGAGHSANYPLNQGVDTRGIDVPTVGETEIPSIDFDNSIDIAEPIVTINDGRAADYRVVLPTSDKQPDGL